ncbi:hypothetical protein LSAT2_026100 [Lamellibrachia satsuma]|nr:hypothetical protein LSAT2_026100 [Lamellibrachia satsuma]
MWVRTFVALCLCASIASALWEPTCDGEVFDNRKFFCCGDTLHGIRSTFKCCDGKLIDGSLYQCKSLSIFSEVKRPHKCNGEEFNKATHFCCGGSLHWITENRKCCGEEVMDPIYYTCNAGLFGYKKSLLRQYNCGGTFYRPDSQVCCHSYKIIPKNSVLKC